MVALDLNSKVEHEVHLGNPWALENAYLKLKISQIFLLSLRLNAYFVQVKFCQKIQ